MSGQHNSENFLVSDSLKGVIDQDSFSSSSARKKKSSKRASLDLEEVELSHFSSDEDLFFPLYGWGESSVTIISPASHLSKFSNPVDSNTTFSLFGKTSCISRTSAVKKDGEWYVTLFVGA
jgi:hypothetical protein